MRRPLSFSVFQEGSKTRPRRRRNTLLVWEPLGGSLVSSTRVGAEFTLRLQRGESRTSRGWEACEGRSGRSRASGFSQSLFLLHEGPRSQRLALSCHCCWLSGVLVYATGRRQSQPLCWWLPAQLLVIFFFLRRWLQSFVEWVAALKHLSPWRKQSNEYGISMNAGIARTPWAMPLNRDPVWTGSTILKPTEWENDRKREGGERWGRGGRRSLPAFIGFGLQFLRKKCLFYDAIYLQGTPKYSRCLI